MPKRNLHIVLAEDDPGIVEVVKMILEEEGYTVNTAVTKKEIESIIKAQIPDLFFLDILLSGITGKEIAEVIRSHPKTKSIPIVMLSANSNIEEIAKEAGATDFLQKPFEIEDLLSMVKKIYHCITSIISLTPFWSDSYFVFLLLWV